MNNILPFPFEITISRVDLSFYIYPVEFGRGEKWTVCKIIDKPEIERAF